MDAAKLTPLHTCPARGRHSLQIEIKRTLYMDEDTLQPNGRYSRTETDLAHLVAKVREYIQGELGQACATLAE